MIQARIVNSTAPTNAISPSHGLNRNITSRYTGNHGASKKANSAWPVANWRKVVRSLSTWVAAPLWPARLA
ncbi:hypothetical protein D9M71_669180 [compost metagenome]